STGTMSAEELMKRGKRHLSVALKEECVNKNHVNLNIVLDHLLSKNKEIDDAETLEWCKSIIAGDKTYKEFLEIVKSYNNSSICGLVWTAEYVAYRCRTCGLSPCMSLCMDCFKAADHDGHDFNMFKSQAGGACDCGDESVMDAKGFCPKHSKNKDRSKIEPPKDLLFVAEIMIPRLVVRLVQYLRHSGAEKQYISKMTSFISFLQELSETGDLMQQIFSNVFTSQNDYTTYMISKSDVGVEYDIYEASLKFDTINVNKYFPELADDLIHKTLLDEMFFWVIKSKFPEHLVTFLLSILPNEQYKLAFVEVFVEHYRCMMVELTHSEDKSSVSNSVVHISVQLLSPLKLAIEIVTKFHLIHIMFACLKHIINQARYGNTLNLTSNVMKEHCYWPIVTDFINILAHPPIVQYFLNSTSLVNAWADVISSLQGLNMNRREHDLHVEFETETYYKAFSAELEICSTPLWALLKHLNDSSSKQLTINIVNILVTYLNKWFTENSVGEIEMNPDEMSFHYPLHRYLSLLISNALQQQGMELTDLLPSLEFLEILYLHPLHLLVREFFFFFVFPFNFVVGTYKICYV
ncbi:hypothetical protein HELRODRAFT_72952, partial [Helobdella robusta]|uniref:E3 ubiquitin-protein ligase n=1 Tax=Helobdella robusta TaxID=6412 RepID=T1G178_HELRO